MSAAPLERSRASRRRALLALAATAVIGAPGCARITREIGRRDPDAVDVVASVKAALARSRTLDAAAIRVGFADGRIRLSGFVDDATASREAESIARRRYPQHDVSNELRVR